LPGQFNCWLVGWRHCRRLAGDGLTDIAGWLAGWLADHLFGTYRKDSPEIGRVATPSADAQAARKAAGTAADTPVKMA
jgi:hypothetical protein